MIYIDTKCGRYGRLKKNPIANRAICLFRSIFKKCLYFLINKEFL
jgi:hypothetical protein